MRKRLAAPILLAAALLSLTACRSSPEVAAYIGDSEITEKRVTEVQESTSFVASDGTSTELIPRKRVVETLVMKQLCEAKHAAASFEKLDITAEQVLGGTGEIPESMRPKAPVEQVPPPGETLTEAQKAALEAEEQARQAQYQKDVESWQAKLAGSEYAQLRAQSLACVYGMPLSGQPTEDEFRALFERAKDMGIFPAGTTYAQAKPNLQSQQVVTNLLAHRELTKLISEGGVVINPRYEPLVIPLLTGPENTVVLGAVLGEPDEVVTQQ